MNGRTRVALVEDHAILAEALHISLSLKGFEVQSVRVPTNAADAPSLMNGILTARPQVVLLDLDLGPAGDGSTLIKPLSRMGCAVVVLTGSVDRARWGQCLAYGARTVLSKSLPLQGIVDVIHRVDRGLPILPPAQRDELIHCWRAQRASTEDVHARLEQLTRRETDVLTELIRGIRVRDIARQAYVSEATVRTQVKSILAKLGVTSQIAAVALARQVGWGGEETYHDFGYAEQMAR